MADIKVGDRVFDENGKQCNVTYISPVYLNHECFRFTFSDGTQVIADADHEWLTADRRARKSLGRRIKGEPKRPHIKPQCNPSVVTTRHIAETLYDGREVNHAVQNALPLQCDSAELPISPYVLGVWLGDGSSKCAEFVCSDADSEIVQHLRSVGCNVGNTRRSGSKTPIITIGIEPRQRCAESGRMQANGSLNSKLGALGLFRNKHVPCQYLRASESQRLELLQGLMDTDGYIERNGNCEFTSTNQRIASAVYELCVSLGLKAVVLTGRATLYGRDCGPKYRVNFTPYIPVFKLKRKRNLVKAKGSQGDRQLRRYIVAADRVDSVAVRCIQVDSPSHLFLATRSMIPTHNTRTGAEFIRSEVERLGAIRIAIIGQTVADVQKVMIEGESGLLACYAHYQKPTYVPSKREVYWPNGAMATTYSGDQPDQLRGPQHHVYWCLVGSTKVLMADGSSKRLDCIKRGDSVATRQGPKKVLAQSLTRRQASIFRLETLGGRVIIGTADHPVWVNGRGFIRLDSITRGMPVCVGTASNGTGCYSIDTPTVITNRRSDFTDSSGKKHTVVESQRDITSTTLTGINQIIGSRISNFFHIPHTVRSTLKRSSRRIAKRLTHLHSGRASGAWPSASSEGLNALSVVQHTAVLLESRSGFAQASASKRRDQARSAARQGCASFAEPDTRQRRDTNDIARGYATLVHVRQEQRTPQLAALSVPSAARSSSADESTHVSAVVNVPYLSTDTITSVEELPQRSDVYDIAVDGAPEFFANGILVHNCDEIAKWQYPVDCWDNLEMGLRLGQQPRGIITTTPKPIKIIRELCKDSLTHVTRGSTFDNAANLPAATIQRLRDKYEGTRLGRQELYAEVLEDLEGALWQRSSFQYKML